MTTSELEILWGVRRDIPGMLRIERMCYQDPWSRQDFVDCLKTRDHLPLVLKLDDILVGYMIYQLRKTSLWIVNIAVHPDFQRHGLGIELVDVLKEKIKKNARRDRLVADVWERNLDAQLFLRACGFKAVRVLRRHHDNGDDAYRMVWCGREN